MNCHIPLQAQRDYIVDENSIVHASASDVRRLEKVKNPAFDARLQKEAITCATCHVRSDAKGSGIIHGPRGSDAAPHRVVKSDVPKNMCVRCHDPGPVQLTTTFLCWFETRREAEAAGQSTSCRDCHMPTIERPIALGQPPRKTLRHTFVGPVPKTYDGFLDRDARGFVPGVSTTAKREGDVLVVTLTNTNAAHHVPSADPERHLVLEWIVSGADGQTSSHRERIGQVWDWGDTATGRVAHRMADNRLAAGASRSFRVPLDGAQSIELTLRHVRLSEENRIHMMNATLDEELRRLAPGAADDLTHMPQRYPRAATMYRARYDVPGNVLSERAVAELTPLDAAKRDP